VRWVAPALLLAACGGGARERPAVIVAPTVESRAALQAAVNRSMGAQVTLADDALTNDSHLIVERALIEGRDLGKPERFRLLKVGERCVLVRERGGERTELAATSCAESR
jgi:hypothetical protein